MFLVHHCQCSPCRDANTSYRRETRELKRMREGRWVDPAEPRRKLLLLREAGATTAQITTLTGISKSTQTLLATGYPDGTQMTRMHSELAARLKAVTSQDLLAVRRAPRPGEAVPADHARIQLQSLTAMGWLAAPLSEKSGVPSQSILRVLRGFNTTEEFRVRIDNLYEELRGIRAPQETRAQRLQYTRAMQKAWQNKWTPMMAERADLPEAA